MVPLGSMSNIEPTFTCENEKYSTVLYKEKAILDNVIKLKNKL